MQLAERPRASTSELSRSATATLPRQQQSAAGTATLQRPLLPLPKQASTPLQQQQLPPPSTPPQQQQQQEVPRPAPEVYIGQPVLRVSDRLRYGVVLAASNSTGSNRATDRGAPLLLQLSPQAAAAGLVGLTAAAESTGSGSRSSSTLTCVIMSGGTNPDHPWRMPDYGFYEQLLRYATAQGWERPGQGDWHARLEEYEWCRDGRCDGWVRRAAGGCSSCLLHRRWLIS